MKKAVLISAISLLTALAAFLTIMSLRKKSEKKAIKKEMAE